MSEGLPPNDVSAEEAVLAACLLDSSAVPRCMPIITPEDFFREQNGWVFQACIDLFNRGEEVTIPTVAHELGEKLDEAGGEHFLVDLLDRHFTAVGVEAHARIVARCSFYRRLIQAASQAASLAYEENPDPAKVYAEALGLFLGTTPPSRASDPKRMGWAEVFRSDEGVTTGIPVIDRNMRGLSGGKVTVAAGPSAGGKSMLAANIAWAVGKQGNPVLIASMEMNDREYEERLVQHISGINHRPNHEGDWNAIYEAQANLESAPISFWYKPRLTIEELWARAYALKADEGLGLVVVDYLQLMQLPPGRETEATKYGMITSRLKQLATELDVHVLLLSQMNRGAASEMRGRDSRKEECLITGQKFPVPFLESLKGAGSIEQDADHVLFIVKHPDCWPSRHISIALAKNRGGMHGSCLMKEEFDSSTIERFSEEEIDKIARGNMSLFRKLRVDQGYVDWSDYEDQEAPYQPKEEGAVS